MKIKIEKKMDCPFATSFPNYKKEMWDGQIPAGKGHERVGGGYFDRWETKYGGGESYNGVLSFGEFSINYKITIFICGNHLNIVDGRYDGKTDLWEYTNIPSRNLAWSVQKKHYHILEPEKIEAILNAECVEDNEYWKMFQARTKELYAAGIINE